MPSRFPGMDPFIEAQVWPDFHADIISAIRAVLAPALRPHTIARIEERVYIQHEHRREHRLIRPGVAVLKDPLAGMRSLGGGTALMVEPVLIPVSLPEEVRETYIEVRLLPNHRVVTVIEVLSPDNKARGARGQIDYLANREAVLDSATHLVEIDLLRGGERMPMEEPFPPADTIVMVSRAPRRSSPLAEVWPMTIQHRLPVIPVPLANGEPDVLLDLQEVFTIVYDRAGYDYSIDYTAPLHPPLNEEEEAWVKELLG